jgi:hypothetical protein
MASSLRSFSSARHNVLARSRIAASTEHASAGRAPLFLGAILLSTTHCHCGYYAYYGPRGYERHRAARRPMHSRFRSALHSSFIVYCFGPQDLHFHFVIS